MKRCGFSIHREEHFFGNLMVVRLSTGNYSRQKEYGKWKSETRKYRISRENIINFILTEHGSPGEGCVR